MSLLAFAPQATALCFVSADDFERHWKGTPMSTALDKTTGPLVTADQLDLIRRTIAKDATQDELKLYLYDCQRQGVHPLDKLIHFTKRGGKYTPVTSIDFMRIRAADSGEMAGSDLAQFVDSPTNPEGFLARVTVYRLTQGQRFAYEGEARWTEYKPDQDFMWRKMPHTMLAKCAEAVALRKGFPKQLAGLYAKEELDQAENRPTVITPDPPATVVDVRSGESVPSSQRPEAPAGFAYIDAYREENGWHHVTFNRADSVGGAITYKTKLERIGTIARQAYQDGIPVSVDADPSKTKGEWWLKAVRVWKPMPTDAELDLEAARQTVARQAGDVL